MVFNPMFHIKKIFGIPFIIIFDQYVTGNLKIKDKFRSQKLKLQSCFLFLIIYAKGNKAKLSNEESR